MTQLDELSFLQISYDNGEFEALDSDASVVIPSGYENRQFAENAVTRLFQNSGLRVRNVDQRWKSPLRHALGIDDFYSSHDSSPAVPSNVTTDLRRVIQKNLPSREGDEPLDIVDINGIPDLLVFDEDDSSNYFFAEVKYGYERLSVVQIEWFDRFDFFDVRIVIVFDDESTRRKFEHGYSLERILSEATRKETFVDMDDRYEMGPEDIADILATLEVGDRLLFNERKQPLTVVETESTITGKATLRGVELRSDRGKTYLLSEDGNHYLDPWNKRELRWVGIST